MKPLWAVAALVVIVVAVALLSRRAPTLANARSESSRAAAPAVADPERVEAKTPNRPVPKVAHDDGVTPVGQAITARYSVLHVLTSQDTADLKLDESQIAQFEEICANHRRRLMGRLAQVATITELAPNVRLAKFYLPATEAAALRDAFRADLARILIPGQIDLPAVHEIQTKLWNFGAVPVVLSLEGDGRSLALSSNFKFEIAVDSNANTTKPTSVDIVGGQWSLEYVRGALGELGSRILYGPPSG